METNKIHVDMNAWNKKYITGAQMYVFLKVLTFSLLRFPLFHGLHIKGKTLFSNFSSSHIIFTIWSSQTVTFNPLLWSVVNFFQIKMNTLRAALFATFKHFYFLFWSVHRKCAPLIICPLHSSVPFFSIHVLGFLPTPPIRREWIALESNLHCNPSHPYR